MKSSIQKRKQRKRRFNAPIHKKKKMLSVHISKELKTKLKTQRRSITAHKGDKVKIMRGDRKGHVGKIMEADIIGQKIYVEGVSNKTSKGIEKLAPIDPSNVLLLEGEFVSDRLEIINRSKKMIEEKKA